MPSSNAPDPAFADGGGRALAALLRRIGVDEHSVIQVAGARGLPALLWLCRHGYEHAGCARGGSPVPAEGADALVVPRCRASDDLGAMLERGPRVRPGGVLIVRCLGEGAARIPAVLERFGYRLFDRAARGRRALFVARRDSGLARAA